MGPLSIDVSMGQYPFMGKARIQAMLARKGREPGVSAVGRIIERALEACATRPASFCNGLQLAADFERPARNWASRCTSCRRGRFRTTGGAAAARPKIGRCTGRIGHGTAANRSGPAGTSGRR